MNCLYVENITDKINLSGNIFIVPNALENSLKTMIESMYKRNNDTSEENAPLCVDTWIVIPMLTENLVSLGIWVTDKDGNEYMIQPSPASSLMPVEIFNGKREGDIVLVDLRAEVFPYGDEPNFITEISLVLRLNQLDSRFRSFGSFEECLEKLSIKHRTRHVSAREGDRYGKHH